MINVPDGANLHGQVHTILMAGWILPTERHCLPQELQAEAIK